jgi:hypothetical protein
MELFVIMIMMRNFKQRHTNSSNNYNSKTAAQEQQ